MGSTRKIGVVIPCFNVERTIDLVLRSFTQRTLEAIDEIVVIDNRSTDNTVSKVTELLQTEEPVARKLTVLQNSQNAGYGGSQKIAWKYLQGRGVSHIMVIHGDNQGDPETIASHFLDVLREEPDADVIIASRFLKVSDISHYSFARRWGNRFFNVLTTFLTGFHMSDAGAAILCIRTDLLSNIPFMTLTSGFKFHPQLNLFLYGNPDVNVREIALDWRDSEAPPSINLWTYAMSLSSLLLRYAWHCRIRRMPLREFFSGEAEPLPPPSQITWQCGENIAPTKTVSVN